MEGSGASPVENQIMRASVSALPGQIAVPLNWETSRNSLRHHLVSSRIRRARISRVPRSFWHVARPFAAAGENKNTCGAVSNWRKRQSRIGQDV